jgi:carboxymethylenebutenolidase
MRSIELAEGPAEAIVSLPPQGTGPGVLLFMDAYGLRPPIRQLADRIASWGYVVLAPNVFHRDGTVGEMAVPAPGSPEQGQALWARIAPRVGRLTTELALADIDAYVAGLTALPEVTRGPLGTVGFCMGGRLAVRAAARHPDRFAACAALHAGGLVTDAEDSPHRALASARAEFLFGHADNDRSMTPDDVAALGAAVDASGLVATNVIVPDAAHGYTMSDLPAWNADATEWAFTALRGLFERTLG